jgi:hypothetical protein
MLRTTELCRHTEGGGRPKNARLNITHAAPSPMKLLLAKARYNLEWQQPTHLERLWKPQLARHCIRKPGSSCTHVSQHHTMTGTAARHACHVGECDCSQDAKQSASSGLPHSPRPVRGSAQWLPTLDTAKNSTTACAMPQVLEVLAGAGTFF